MAPRKALQSRGGEADAWSGTEKGGIAAHVVRGHWATWTCDLYHMS